MRHFLGEQGVLEGLGDCALFGVQPPVLVPGVLESPGQQLGGAAPLDQPHGQGRRAQR